MQHISQSSAQQLPLESFTILRERASKRSLPSTSRSKPRVSKLHVTLEVLGESDGIPKSERWLSTQLLGQALVLGFFKSDLGEVFKVGAFGACS